MIKNRIIVLVVFFGLGCLGYAIDASPTGQDKTPKPMAKDNNGYLAIKQIKDLAGKVLIDAQLEVTQPIQVDKYLNFVNISTPTLTPASGHSLLFANDSANQFIAKWSDGSTTVLGSGSGSSGDITGVVAGYGMTGGGTSGDVTLNVDGSTVLIATTAATVYLTQSSATLTYLYASSAPVTYLFNSSATATYLYNSSATATYLTQSSATATYLYASSAPVTYLTQSSATATYCHPNGTNCPAGSTVSLSSTQTWTATQSFNLMLIRGATSAFNAPTGYVGEYVEAYIDSFTNLPTSGQFGDLTSISLTPGDWDISATMRFNNNGGTWSAGEVGISSNTGNSQINLINGNNRLSYLFANTSTAVTVFSISIPTHRVSLSATTIYYLKYSGTYTAGSPQAVGRISARRVR